MKNLILINFVVLLAGCGGGGGTATTPVTPVMPAYSNPYNFSQEIITQASTMGTLLNTTTSSNCDTMHMSNSPCSIFAPTAEQTMSGINLSIDANSPSNDLVVADSSMINIKYTQPLDWLGWEIANSSVVDGNRISTGSLAFTTPLQDVRQAWATGFSGQGVNALVLDGFNLQPTGGGQTPDTHGYRVMAAIKCIAPNVNLFSRQGGINIYAPKVVTTNMTMSPDTKIDVINMSFGHGIVNTPESTIDEYHPIFNGTSEYFTNSDEAVLVSAAGNDNLDSYSNNQSRLHQTILSESSTQPRALFVGLIDSSTDLLHANSNHAGSNLEMQEQFLVEYDLGNFSENTYAFKNDGSDTIDLNGGLIDNGTSLAAPTVVGKVALLRSKFPTLNGANTAKILLDTATYEGLACWNGTLDSCPINEYGQGRIDLPAALSPIGVLR